MKLGSRALAATLIRKVVKDAEPLPGDPSTDLKSGDRAFFQEILYGTLRKHLPLRKRIENFIQKPIKGKQSVVYELLEIGLYQRLYMNSPDYAVINETVQSAKELGIPGMSGLVNAIMRKLYREDIASLAAAMESSDPALAHSCPAWLFSQMTGDWGLDAAAKISQAANEKPGMWIRANEHKVSAEEYVRMLQASEIAVERTQGTAILLADTLPVTKLPGFSDGLCYVQDASAQETISWLDPQIGERILDACAAPGGKSTHILERCRGQIDLTCVDPSQRRLDVMAKNLARLGYAPKVTRGHAQKADEWWNGQQFDRILCDAPCSGTGVIRRHPDIRYVRRPDDIKELTKTQSDILDALWQTLKPGGVMLYSTCSILKCENESQISAFIGRTDGAKIENMHQRFPGDGNRDGFFYCKIRKLM